MAPGGDLDVECFDDGAGRVVVAVVGDLDHGLHARLAAELSHRLDTGVDELVVDLSSVTFCDSSGLRVLVDAAQRLHAAGGRFLLRGAAGQPQRALELTGLGVVFARADARAAMDGPTVQS